MNDRYQRQMILDGIGDVGQAKLQSVRVLCVGAGGLASTLTLYLAGAGIGCIGIVDGDRVDRSNLHRQVLYHDEDVGSFKSQVAAKQLNAHNPDIQVDAYTYFLNEGNVLDLVKQYDIIADCTDRFDARYLINDACMTVKKPNVFASAQQFEGYCTVFPGDGVGPCYRCWFDQPPQKEVLNCNQAGVLGTVPGVLGVLQANEIIKWTLNMPGYVGEVLIFNALSGDFRRIQLSQSADCPICADGILFDRLPRSYLSQPLSEYLDDRRISSEAVMNLIKANQSFVLVDVRSDAEFQAGHLTDQHIPVDHLQDRAMQSLSMDDVIILYCQAGYRSRQACQILLNLGFQQVFFIHEVLQDYQDEMLLTQDLFKQCLL